MSKTFNTLDVVSTYTGRLCATIGGVYEVTGFVLNDPGIMTHQLPAASRACEPILESQHSWLNDLTPPDRTTPDYLERFGEWCASIIDDHGPQIELKSATECLADSAWVAGNALRDLADIAANRPIIGVVTSTEESGR